MSSVCFQAEYRLPLNRTGLKRLRKDGRLPGVIFGMPASDGANTMIHISMKEFQRWVRGGGSGVLELDLESSKKVPVLVEGIQKDVVTREYLHIDFLLLQKDEVVRTKIPVELVGTAQGTKLGGIVLAQSTTIEVQALPADLIPFISVDISELEIGQSIRIGEVPLPQGVSLVSSPDDFLVSVVSSRG
jgi:large subunit ribosomal protein L25